MTYSSKNNKIPVTI